MQIYKYKNYEEYLKVQISGFRRKMDCIWASSSEIKKILCPYIVDWNIDISAGLCHGTRNGAEQRAFIEGFKELGKEVSVIGTELGPEAAIKFANTIEWDFHNVKDEWKGSIDLIYSNALDHSYNPRQCLKAWMSCLNEKGLCILEWTNCHIPSSRLDPFGATYNEYKELIEADYELVDVLRGSSPPLNRYYFVVRCKNVISKESN